MDVWLNGIELKRGLNLGILLDLINLGCFGRERREIGKGMEVFCLMTFFFLGFFFFMNPMKMMKNTREEAYFLVFFCHVGSY